jgi:hypothetical protein
VNQLKNAIQTHNETIKFLEQQKLDFEGKLEESHRTVSAIFLFISKSLNDSREEIPLDLKSMPIYKSTIAC